MNAAQKLIGFGQSIWYDNISRTILQNGELKRLIDDFDVRGLTSNPTIFDNAISKSSVYDDTIAQLKSESREPDYIFEKLAIADIAAAADLLLPVYQQSGGEDGFVSIEVSPLLAANTTGTIEEGLRLFKTLARPNIMIKVPGTPEGIPAVLALLEQGVNVNITLLFSVENYIDVARTYQAALRTRVKQGLPVKDIRSVASFFVSRVDTAVDKKLQQIIDLDSKSNPAKAEKAKECLGRFGVANSRVAYKRFEEIFLTSEFADLKAKGAAVQRPLWASTGVKNPAYRDTLYIEELIGPHTVNTIPHETLMAFADHGKAQDRIKIDVEGARAFEGTLGGLGIDVKALLHELQVDGVRKFTESFSALNQTIVKKLG